MQTFGLEFAREQYGIGQVLANLLLLVIGAGSVVGVVAGGLLGDALIRARHLAGRIQISAAAATTTVILFIPALLAHGTLPTAVPYLCGAAFMLSAQTAPLRRGPAGHHAVRTLGASQSIGSVIRSFAQALGIAVRRDLRSRLRRWPQRASADLPARMLIPLAASAALLYRALRTYPQDVATAAATEQLHVSPGAG